MNTNTLASNPACVFIKVEQVIEELCTNWSIGSETVDVILNANVIIIRPNWEYPKVCVNLQTDVR